ncbi:unnamed protein product [Eruca vesicaria subsp. sativa]|uniref:FRIGIDA-like protein n=1 Tax=Eruca vesicaria subsp. sativa TaxID=29727 RepID=A0ABC8M0G4_ERUVS|nr:unnamed protein product [Eruca vesicaria subsp. sativa]
MEKRSVEDAPAVDIAKKLKTDSSQMLKTLHDHLDKVVEEVELKENQLHVLSSKLVEIQKQIEQQTDKLKSTEVVVRNQKNALGWIRHQIKSGEETLVELRTSLENTGNELELKKTELENTGNELELKKAELKKNTELRVRSSVLVKHELQPIEAESELSTGDARLLQKLSSVALTRREVSNYLRVISNPAKLVLDLVERQLRTAYQRQTLGLQESVVKNLVLFFEDIAGIRGSEKSQLQFRAKELGNIWKENITIEAPRSSLEALAFLLFIVAFGLKRLINEEETVLLASSVFHYRQGPELFQFFGLKLKIPEFVRDLIKDHQYIPAVRIICLFKRKDFSATTLLMKEITDLRRSAMGKVQNKDVGRLRAIVELVADYKLDIDLPGELIAKLMLLRENSTPPELHCSVEVDEETCSSSSNSKAACSGVDLLVPKRETNPFVNPSTNCS